MNAKAARLLAAFGNLGSGSVIVEIGCVRFPTEVPSDGFSTMYLAIAAGQHGWYLHSVDIDAGAVANARMVTAGYAVTVHESRGADWLRSFDGPINGLFLDGSANPVETLAQYHAARLATGAVVVVDDVQPIDKAARGKGDLLLDALDADGWLVDVFDTEPGYRMAVATWVG